MHGKVFTTPSRFPVTTTFASSHPPCSRISSFVSRERVSLTRQDIASQIKSGQIEYRAFRRIRHKENHALLQQIQQKSETLYCIISFCLRLPTFTTFQLGLNQKCMDGRGERGIYFRSRRSYTLSACIRNLWRTIGHRIIFCFHWVKNVHEK